MRLSSVLLRAFSGPLGVCMALGASGGSAAGELRLSGWYVSAGVGANRSSSMEQVGHNRDTTCYPDEDCSLLPGGTPGGYRWRYDLDAGTGTAFEVLIGRNTGRARLELSAAQRKNDIDQKFTGITYLDGTLIQDAGNDIQSNATASVGDLTTRTLSLSAYYDFPLAANPITPYLGAGLGLSFVEVSKLHFSTRYTGTQSPSDPPLQSFDSRQDVDLSDTALAKHLYAGAGHCVSDKVMLDLKLAYTHVGDIEDTDGYSVHPVEGLTSLTKVSGIGHGSLTLTLKYLLGD